MKRTYQWHQWHHWLALFLLVVISACGGSGGVGSGGSGSGLVSYSEGVVSGFGSVMVDGAEFADTDAAVQVQTETGNGINAQVKLGQRVLVTHGKSDTASARTASAIWVLPQLIGPVDAAVGTAVDASGWLRVAAQWVQVVDVASASASRPATLIDGYASASAIAGADEVEVHGNWVQDASRNAWVLVATRIEKLSASPAHVLVSGVVQSLPSANQVRLNHASGTLLQADPLQTGLITGLTAGQIISAWVLRSDWIAQKNAPSTQALPASRLSLQGVAGILANATAQEDALHLSGLASEYDAASDSVNVQGVRVRLPAGSGLDAAALRAGAWVQVTGKGQGKDNALSVQASSASQASTRPSGEPIGVELKGVLGDVNWSAARVSFVLRDAQVSANAAVITQSCRQLPADADAYVEVSGSITPPSTTVQARRVQCSAAPPRDAMRLRTGFLQSASSTALTLQTRNGLVQMQVDPQTFFEQPPTRLIGQNVDVEGVQITGSSSLRAKVVRRARPPL